MAVCSDVCVRWFHAYRPFRSALYTSGLIAGTIVRRLIALGLSVARIPAATARMVSACKNQDVRAPRVSVSDHSTAPVATSITRRVMRIWSDERSTVPSTTASALSARPMSLDVLPSPATCIADVGEITCTWAAAPSCALSASVIPAANTSSALLPDPWSSGNTASVLMGGPSAAPTGGAPSPPARRAPRRSLLRRSASPSVPAESAGV